jgi:hypothetical protein
MRKLILNILFLSCLSNSFGQKNLDNFKGDLTFKDSWFYAPLSRLFYDTLINYSTIHVTDSIEMEQMTVLYPDKDLKQKFIPFKLSKQNDSIFLKYFDPIINRSTSDYIFPLNKRDTVDIPICYQMFIDSFRPDGSKTYKKSLSENDDEMSNNLRTIYSKDTILNFGEYKMSCYMFEQSKLTGHYRDVNFIRKILIDKVLLIPIDIKEYHYYKTKRRANRQIPKEKWLLTRHTRLIYIDN